MLSGLAVPLAALPAGIAFAIGGSEGVLALAVAAYAAATLAALRIPPTRVADAPATAAESAELRGVGVLLAASAMGLVRGIVGFLTFLLLFDLREGEPWRIGAVLLLSGAGALTGSALAPVLRRSIAEERMLITVLSVAVTGGLAAAWIGGLAASMLLAAVIAVVSTAGRMAFDSLVQRDAPDANRGRSFATFELRFQLVWVVGAVIPVLISIPLRAGFLVIAGVAGFALFSYVAGQRAAQRTHADRPVDESAAPPVADPTVTDHTAIHRPPAVDPTTIQE
jgi:hypothetical protein